jgi:hypothetical protein
MTAIYGLFPTPNLAQRAVDRLRTAGVGDRDIIIVSSEPFEEYPFSHYHKETWMYWIAGGGGVLGLAFGAWLTSFTETSWPLSTGGMPIVAWWPNLVVTFELTMLSAILATVVTLLITTKLPRRQPKLYDPRVSDGLILVGVEGSSSDAPLRQALMIDGIADLRTIES